MDVQTVRLDLTIVHSLGSVVGILHRPEGVRVTETTGVE
jgi:hypothetical protein